MTKRVKRPATEVSPMGSWELFERRMAAYISTMFDPRDILKIYVPRANEADPWVIEIQTVSDSDTVRIDYQWDEVYARREAPTDATQRLRRVIQRERFMIPHPQLLTVSAEGPAAAGIGVLGLAVRGEVSDPDGTSVPTLHTSTRDQVLGALLTHVRSEYDEDAELDDDEDLPLTINGVRLWVGVTPSRPAIMLFACIVNVARSRRQACVDVNGLNRSHVWSRWVCRDHAIWQHLTIPSTIFQPELFDEMLHQFVSDYMSNRMDLADRLGGQPASG